MPYENLILYYEVNSYANNKVFFYIIVITTTFAHDKKIERIIIIN